MSYSVHRRILINPPAEDPQSPVAFFCAPGSTDPGGRGRELVQRVDASRAVHRG